MAIKTARNGVITFKDGSGTPKTLALEFDGEFKADIPGTDVTFHKDRGVLAAAPEVSLGEDQEMTLSFKAKVKLLTNAAAASMADVGNALAGGGYLAANWTSTVVGSSRLLLDILYTDGTNTWAFEDCNITESFGESAEADELSFSARCPHPYPTIT